MITPENLKRLAEAMGKEIACECDTHIDVIWAHAFTCTSVRFQPHKDSTQAFEVLEKLIVRGFDIEPMHICEDDMFVIPLGDKGDVSGYTLKEAITLAAIALLDNQ